MLQILESVVFGLGVLLVPFEQIWLSTRVQLSTTDPHQYDGANGEDPFNSYVVSRWLKMNGFSALALITFLNLLLVCLLKIPLTEKPLKFSKKFSWVLRPETNPGLWCMLQLPLALLIGCLVNNSQISHLYVMATVISLGLLGTSLFLVTWTCFGDSDREHVFKSSLNVWCLIPTLACGIALNHILGMNLALSYIFSGIAQFFFIHFIINIPRLCAGSFSIGEAFLISQGVTIFLVTAVASVATRLLELLAIIEPVVHKVEVSESTYFLQGLLLGVATIVALLYYVPILRSPFLFYSFSTTTSASVAYFTSYLLLKAEPITWLLYFIMSSKVKLILIALWVVCVVLAIFFVISLSLLYSVWRGSPLTQKTTIIRKYFHGIVIFIFTPGVMFEKDLLYVATGVALAAFLFVECIRVFRIPPLGWAINKSFAIFSDGKDSGFLILTHIYLLVGCSLPIWIFPQNLESYDFHISLLSGVLCLGVGDTAASVIGSSFGKYKLPGTKKTIEGTLSALVLQALASFVWIFWDPYLTNYVALILATILSCTMEAVTLQIDNLVLPLFLYIMLVSIS